MIAALLTYLSFIPAAVMCMLPMRHQLRRGPSLTAAGTALLLAALLPLAAWVSVRFELGCTTLLPPLLGVCFLTYHLSLNVPVSRSLSVFFAVCALMFTVDNVVNGIVGRRFPEQGAEMFTTERALTQFSISTLVAVLLARPLWSNGSRLVDALKQDSIWWMTLPFSTLIILMNYFLRPLKYETLFVNNVYKAFTVSVSALLLIWLLLIIVYYHIVIGILNAAEVEQRMRVLEMQESQFLAQQRYMRLSAQARHDFRQSVRAMKNLYHAGDYEALGGYIDRYFDSLPSAEMKSYCGINALNALLNHYAQMTQRDGIRCDFRVDLPDRLTVTDVDLCAVVGNILENAVTASLELPEPDRLIRLAILTRNGNRLYIVATNRVKEPGMPGPVSPRRGGIGLKSIVATAEKYNGKAEFSREGCEFHSDVMLPLG